MKCFFTVQLFQRSVVDYPICSWLQVRLLTASPEMIPFCLGRQMPCCRQNCYRVLFPVCTYAYAYVVSKIVHIEYQCPVGSHFGNQKRNEENDISSQPTGMGKLVEACRWDIPHCWSVFAFHRSRSYMLNEMSDLWPFCYLYLVLRVVLIRAVA